MPRFVGFDKSMTPRIYAEHPNIDVAETWLMDEIFRVVRARPDLGPVMSWTIERQRLPTGAAVMRGSRW